ncbi:Tetratricopeptide-like helical [Artemisia annua]|uniref:Tetratricopeptide-like helical n=1 Tax=Artemisia annua TaxID=35608 RepID=A0A2U1PV56_ARTAN|nr:Tetratricopeptide-like helical [Artemisia annua]
MRIYRNTSGVDIIGLFDTGADYNCVSAALVEKLRLEVTDIDTDGVELGEWKVCIDKQDKSYTKPKKFPHFCFSSLISDNNPSKAVSLFWAAINSGDRVDSALKDMAVVMKQLNRSEEAIEAIKSFRHLCEQEAQESLDNILLELYKRSGRVEELKNIEEGNGEDGNQTQPGTAARCTNQTAKRSLTFARSQNQIEDENYWRSLPVQ